MTKEANSTMVDTGDNGVKWDNHQGRDLGEPLIS